MDWRPRYTQLIRLLYYICFGYSKYLGPVSTTILPLFVPAYDFAAQTDIVVQFICYQLKLYLNVVVLKN